MAKEELVEFGGKVSEVLPDNRFRVILENGFEVWAYSSGRLKKNRIRVLAGDRVTLEMSPYRAASTIATSPDRLQPRFASLIQATLVNALDPTTGEQAMSNSEEWEELHLTPGGWVAGSYRHTPWPKVDIAPPDAGVLTVRRHVTATYCGPSRAIEDRTPQTRDMALIESLLARYGNPEFSI